MGILLRILFGLALIGLFSFIVFSSFFETQSKFEFPEILLVDEMKNESFQIEEKEFIAATYSLDENIYSSDKELTFTGTTLSIANGNMYLTSLRDISKDYSFVGEGYEIQQNGIGEVYIDTLSSPGKVFIMSVNSPLKVTLTNADASEKYTSIFLYPHMYLEFQPARGKFLKNADVVRVETVYKLGYFPAKIGEGEYDTFLKKYISGDTSFFTQAYLRLDDIYNAKGAQLPNFEKQQVLKLPGYDMVQRYLHLFVNEEKKKIFYKNMVLDGFLEMFNKSSYDSSLMIQVFQDLETLEKLDIDSYNEMMEIGEYLSSLVYSSFETRYVVPKIYFAQFISGERNENLEWYFPIYSFSLYKDYDSNGIFSSIYYQKYLSSFKEFFKGAEGKEFDEKLHFQYFSYFLDKQFHFLLSQGLNENGFDRETGTLQNLIEYITLSYNKENTDRVTALFIFSGILHDIDSFLRMELFLPQRKSGNLLELQKNKTLSNQDINKLSAEFDKIKAFFEGSKVFMESDNARDIALKEDIENSSLKIDEYFSALKNYEVYTLNYDVSKQNILGLDVFSDEDVLTLSEENAREYLSQFSGVSFDGMGVKIVDDYYYEISNVFISGKSFSFDLYPYTSYKLQNIVQDGEEYSFVYKLQNIEYEWQEKYETASEEERDQYDFSRFFIVTFLSKEDVVAEEYIKEETKLNEDKTEIVFKRDILLGDKGEFQNISSVADIKYEDISLDKKGDIYDIFLNNFSVNLEYTIDTGNKARGKAYLDSKYVLDDTNHHFENVKMKVVNTKASTSTESYEFDGNKVNVVGKIHISEFEKVLKEIFVNLQSYVYIYSTLTQQYGSSIEISMYYTLYNGKMSFKFASEGKSYTILLTGNEVTEIYKGTQKILSSPITPLEILDFLN